MDIEQLRETFLNRLHIELRIFEESMLCEDKAVVFTESYKIETYKNLYNILVDAIGQISEALLRKLICLDYEILDFFYQEWLKREDSSFAELKEYVDSKLENLAEK